MQFVRYYGVHAMVNKICFLYMYKRFDRIMFNIIFIYYDLNVFINIFVLNMNSSKGVNKKPNNVINYESTWIYMWRNANDL